MPILFKKKLEKSNTERFTDSLKKATRKSVRDEEKRLKREERKRKFQEKFKSISQKAKSSAKRLGKTALQEAKKAGKAFVEREKRIRAESRVTVGISSNKKKPKYEF